MKKYFTFLAIFISLTVFSQVQTIGAGWSHSLFVCSDSTVSAWGRDLEGQLGNGANTNSNISMPVNSLTNIISIAGGGNFSIALKSDSTVWTWGDNMSGQLGNGTITDSNVPVQVTSLTGVIAVSAGYEHSIALKSDGTIWIWGLNFSGQLGNGNNTPSNIPIHITSLTGVIAIAGGFGHSLALKSDGTVWAWGSNGNGELGNGNNISSTVPVQVSSLTNIIAIAAGKYRHSHALKNDGTVWDWGNSITIPMQVSSLSGITAIAAGGNQSIALKNDSTVWVWDNNAIATVPVSGLTNVVSITSGYSHLLVTKNDGTVWSWGWNTSGEQGNGNNITTNFPVQVWGPCGFYSHINSTNYCINNPCTGTAVVNTGSGSLPYSYLWSNSQTTQSINGLCAGTYSVIVVDAVNDTTTASVTITNNPLPSVSYTPSLPNMCQNSGWLPLSGGIPVSGLYSGTSVSFNSFNTTSSGPGTFTIVYTYTDFNGCVNSDSSQITVNPLATVAYNQSTTSMCVNWPAQTLTAGTPAGGIYSGTSVTGNTFNPSTAGAGTFTIVYTYTDANGCTNSDSSQITVSLCSGIESNVENSKFVISPNPSTGKFVIASETTNGSIEIYNTLGKIIFSTEIKTNKMEVDLSSQANGIYFLKFQSEEIILSKKIIIE